jgi:hypothetical protein
VRETVLLVDVSVRVVNVLEDSVVDVLAVVVVVPVPVIVDEPVVVV